MDRRRRNVKGEGGWWGNLKEEDCLEDLSVDKGLTIKRVLKIGL